MSRNGTHFLVFANEKGGTGKSTTAVHSAIALSHKGYRVACIDLDPRQRTLYRYMENRVSYAQKHEIVLPTPHFSVFEYDTQARLEQLMERMSQNSDYLIFDTPGRDDKFARFVATRADTLVTPLNDSFVDFDLIGQVDPDNYKVRKLSFYAELIWEARKARAMADGTQVDWVVLRNRLQHIDAHNRQRLELALGEMAKRVGFRTIPGLSERVIYRELFPSGLTLFDKGYYGNISASHLAARQELRAMIKGLNLPDPVEPAQLVA
jgi:chromosome partitioning protein